MGSRKAIFRFAEEVTVRYGSLEAFYLRLHAAMDTEPTVILPVIDDPLARPMAYSAIEQPSPVPVSFAGRWR
ncbi:hypothetical protein [Nocardia sp. BMG111209]|uniref:hypothetical protein n=1 Tax=Nocardia sp. BMG111209 TaxID=1160137 RepID=UPI00035CF7C0|nr:hypothetical protein [Nocardia sp. BMG111209]